MILEKFISARNYEKTYNEFLSVKSNLGLEDAVDDSIYGKDFQKIQLIKTKIL